MILVNHNWLYLLVLGEPTVLLGVIFISLISPGFLAPPLKLSPPSYFLSCYVSV